MKVTLSEIMGAQEGLKKILNKDLPVAVSFRLSKLALSLEKELTEFLSEKFIIRKVQRSHRHRTKGGAGKRRTISLYVEKDY